MPHRAGNGGAALLTGRNAPTVISYQTGAVETRHVRNTPVAVGPVVLHRCAPDLSPRSMRSTLDGHNPRVTRRWIGGTQPRITAHVSVDYPSNPTRG
jgi:hypothetical protein